jgi:hypothetical protein
VSKGNAASIFSIQASGVRLYAGCKEGGNSDPHPIHLAVKMEAASSSETFVSSKLVNLVFHSIKILL